MREQRVTRVFSEIFTPLLHVSQVMLVAVHPWDCNGGEGCRTEDSFYSQEG